MREVVVFLIHLKRSYYRLADGHVKDIFEKGFEHICE